MSGHLPAFPVPLNPGQGFQKISDADGATKRELFAAMAMQGILGNPYWNEHGDFTSKAVAESARQYADALLAELAKDGAA